MGHQPTRRDAYRGRAIPMCYYDIDDTGFYDEFGNPIDPSQMDDYLMYGGTDFTGMKLANHKRELDELKQRIADLESQIEAEEEALR